MPYRGLKPRMPVLERLLDGRRVLLLDIGARGGPHHRWRRFHQLVDMIGFEPDREECERLNRQRNASAPRRRFLPHALSSTDGTRPFFICREPGCSSLLKPNTTFVEVFHFGAAMAVVGTCDIEVTTLDSVCQREGLRPDVIKIDTQGAELDVLLGAGRVLERTLVLETEVEFNPQYLDQALFADVDRLLRSRGFLLLGLRRSLWRRRASTDRRASAAGGVLVHGDVLYWNQHMFTSDEPLTPPDLAAAAVLLAAYRQNDFLLHLLKTPLSVATGVTAADREALLEELLEQPTVGAMILGRLLAPIAHHRVRAIVDALRDPNATDWHDPEFF